MWVGVLGSTQAAIGDARLNRVDLGSRRPRALVAALALHRGRSVSTDAIVDLLWGDEPPASYTTTLHAYVSGLRRALEPDRAPRAPSTVLVTTGTGYALKVDPADHDLVAFEQAVAQVHQTLGPSGHLGPSTHTRPELDRLGAELDDALGLWRGTPFEDLGDAPDAVAERTRLDDLRMVAVEDRAAIALACGDHAVLTAELESLTAANPLRERLWALRALALYRAGRQADALDALAQVRRLLDEELGLEPGTELRDLQAAILRQDAALAWVPTNAAAPPAAETGTEPAATVPVPTQRSGREVAGPAAPPWPTVGRDAQLRALESVLDTAAGGQPAFAALVGEPGIGKSRLAYETIRAAHARGVRVAVGRCSQDDGAPPLWPWAAVFDALGTTLPQDASADDEGSRFRTWHAISQAVVEAAQKQPLLVVLDDLHWADTSSLRVLRMLVESADDVPLSVLGTWRNAPEPTGALADVVDTMARRHAVRLDLSGLTGDETAEIVAAVAHDQVSESDAAALRDRTDGNPFFLVEYARLADGSGTVASLLAEADPPAAVNDVLVRRVRGLPEATQRRLATASAIGRQFDLATLASATDDDVDGALDDLDPAIDAGLVRVVGPDEFLFAHALVRDSVYAGLGSRRARVHAKIAGALADAPGQRVSEIARHWLLAGPAFRKEACVACLDAAEQARQAHGYEEAAGHLETALADMRSDPACPPKLHYDALMRLIDAQRWAGNWDGLIASMTEAIEVAKGMGDLALAAEAATSATVGALWQSAGHGEVHDGVVAALREALRGMSTEDSPLRCRVMLALSNEIYYASSVKERDALTEEAVAMARRLGDRRLLLDACQISFVSTWRASTAPQRLAYTEESIELARELGEERAGAVGITLRAVVLYELGRVDEAHAQAEEAWATCHRLRLAYGLLVLASLELPWQAMRGRFDLCDEMIETIRTLDAQMSLMQYDDAAAGALLAQRLWEGRAEEMVPVLTYLDEEHRLPVMSARAMYLTRAGRVDEARELLTTRTIDWSHDDWFAPFNWGCAAEAAYRCQVPDVAAQAYQRLAPLAGRPLVAGSGVAMGPVDAFLALAAVATGEVDLARGHADAAMELCDRWDISLVRAWLQELRDADGF
jgi:DNA-binding SARP family transcriptional activator